MKPSKNFKDLIVRQKAHQFVLGVYKYTRRFPKEEKYGLTSQFRNAAVSVAANITEGYAKRSKLDKIRLMNIAQGSLEECKCYLILSKDLEYGEDRDLEDFSEEVSRLLSAYIRSIENTIRN